MEFTRQLDEEWKDLAGLVPFKGEGDGKAAHPRDVVRDTTDDVFDNILTQLKTEGGYKKAQPAKQVLSEKDKAQQRREKLEKMQKMQSGLAEAEEEEATPHVNKREKKLQTKRDQAMQAAIEREELAESTRKAEKKTISQIQSTIDQSKKEVRFEADDELKSEDEGSADEGSDEQSYDDEEESG